MIRPVPVPESARRQRPWATPKVFAAPDGDLTNDDIRPAEVLVDPKGDFGIALRIYASVDGNDLKTLVEGGYVEITLHSVTLPVFSLAVMSDGRKHDQAGA